MTVYILDTSAIIGIAPGLLRGTLVTVEEVVEEARSLESRAKVETAVATGKIRVMRPSRVSVRRVLEEMRKTGDKLSSTDVKVLALALDLRDKEGVLLTDDYAVQNLASRLEIPFHNLRTSGISEAVMWVHICPACGKRVSPFTRECPVCGTPVQRRRMRSEEASAPSRSKLIKRKKNLLAEP